MEEGKGGGGGGVKERVSLRPFRDVSFPCRPHNQVSRSQLGYERREEW